MKKLVQFEATGRTLDHVLVNADNENQIKQVLEQEREGFGAGIDPQETPEVLQFIARRGSVWLQYAVEDSNRVPTGVMELLPLDEALKFDPDEIIKTPPAVRSPLDVIVANHEKVFSYVRKFAVDKDIVYHHGISMSRRGKGYGTILLNHVLDNTPNLTENTIACFLDAGRISESGTVIPEANKRSFTLHMKAGFVLVGVIDPPVYEGSIIYYSVLRPKRTLGFSREKEKINFSEANSNMAIQQVRDLTQSGYVGTNYDRKAQEMLFRKI